MSEVKHTPGPWKVAGHPTDLCPQEVVRPFHEDGDASNSGLICEFTHSLYREQQSANAWLIAAAPDLLEACRAVVEKFQSMQDAEGYLMCEAAIAKAAPDPLDAALHACDGDIELSDPS